MAKKSNLVSVSGSGANWTKGISDSLNTLSKSLLSQGIAKDELEAKQLERASDVAYRNSQAEESKRRYEEGRTLAADELEARQLERQSDINYRNAQAAESKRRYEADEKTRKNLLQKEADYEDLNKNFALGYNVDEAKKAALLADPNLAADVKYVYDQGREQIVHNAFRNATLDQQKGHDFGDLGGSEALGLTKRQLLKTQDDEEAEQAFTYNDYLKAKESGTDSPMLQRIGKELLDFDNKYNAQLVANSPIYKGELEKYIYQDAVSKGLKRADATSAATFLSKGTIEKSALVKAATEAQERQQKRYDKMGDNVYKVWAKLQDSNGKGYRGYKVNDRDHAHSIIDKMDLSGWAGSLGPDTTGAKALYDKAVDVYKLDPSTVLTAIGNVTDRSIFGDNLNKIGEEFIKYAKGLDIVKNGGDRKALAKELMPKIAEYTNPIAAKKKEFVGDLKALLGKTESFPSFESYDLRIKGSTPSPSSNKVTTDVLNTAKKHSYNDVVPLSELTPEQLELANKRILNSFQTPINKNIATPAVAPIANTYDQDKAVLQNLENTYGKDFAKKFTNNTGTIYIQRLDKEGKPRSVKQIYDDYNSREDILLLDKLDADDLKDMEENPYKIQDYIDKGNNLIRHGLDMNLSSGGFRNTVESVLDKSILTPISNLYNLSFGDTSYDETKRREKQQQLEASNYEKKNKIINDTKKYLGISSTEDSVPLFGGNLLDLYSAGLGSANDSKTATAVNALGGITGLGKGILTNTGKNSIKVIKPKSKLDIIKEQKKKALKQELINKNKVTKLTKQQREEAQAAMNKKNLSNAEKKANKEAKQAENRKNAFGEKPTSTTKSRENSLQNEINKSRNDRLNYGSSSTKYQAKAELKAENVSKFNIKGTSIPATQVNVGTSLSRTSDFILKRALDKFSKGDKNLTVQGFKKLLKEGNIKAIKAMEKIGVRVNTTPK